MNSETGILEPTMLPDKILIAPEEVLRVVRCNCTSKSYL